MVLHLVQENPLRLVTASGNILSQSLPDRRAGSPTSQTIIEQQGCTAITRVALITLPKKFS